MSCSVIPPKFRLLDGYVGWSEAAPTGLLGLHDEFGLRLNTDHEGEMTAHKLVSLMPPPWLVRGCGPCEWYLLHIDDRGEAHIRRRERCIGTDCWRDWTRCLVGWEQLAHPVAVATQSRRLAVADQERNCVFVWSTNDGRLTAVIPVIKPEVIAFTPWGELAVVSGDIQPRGAMDIQSRGSEGDGAPSAQSIQRLYLFSPTGDPRGYVDLQADRSVRRMVAGQDRALWLARGPVEGPFEIWRIIPESLDKLVELVISPDAPACCHLPDIAMQRITDGSDMTKALGESGVYAVSKTGFCLHEQGADGSRLCFNAQGCSITEREVLGPEQSSPEQSDTLITKAIDSYVPRCRWHRVRLDADLPSDTRVTVQMATSEINKNDDGKDHIPHDHDWTTFSDTTDFLINQPPGRYLFLKITLKGTTTRTPVIRRVRLDFPRETSLEQLPAVYRDNPEAEDFTERFLALFDASIEDLDQKIERFAALLNPDRVPEAVLPWLASFLSIVFDPAWSADLRLSLIKAAPQLFRQRGTVAGLTFAVELIFGVKPAIEEGMQHRAWSQITRDGRTGARLGAARLFGRSTSRFRLGRSALGLAPVRSYGNPDADPFSGEAHRFTIRVPLRPQFAGAGRDRLNQLIASQKPAHTAHVLHIGQSGLIVGPRMAVGIDSVLGSTPSPVLGVNVRLNRDSILRCGPRRTSGGLRVGITAAIGIHTVME